MTFARDPGITAKDIRVTQVVVDPIGTNDPRVAVEIERKMVEYMPKCAKGRVPHTLFVRVDGFQDGSSAAAAVFGSFSTLDTHSTFVQDANGKTTAVADFKDKVGGGGLIAAAAMAFAPRILADRLGDNLCKSVLGIRVELDYKVDSGNQSRS